MKIQAWENHQKAKTEAEMRKIEVFSPVMLFLQYVVLLLNGFFVHGKESIVLQIHTSNNIEICFLTLTIN